MSSSKNLTEVLRALSAELALSGSKGWLLNSRIAACSEPVLRLLRSMRPRNDKQRILLLAMTFTPLEGRKSSNGVYLNHCMQPLQLPSGPIFKNQELAQSEPEPKEKVPPAAIYPPSEVFCRE